MVTKAIFYYLCRKSQEETNFFFYLITFPKERSGFKSIFLINSMDQYL